MGRSACALYCPEQAMGRYSLLVQLIIVASWYSVLATMVDGGDMGHGQVRAPAECARSLLSRNVLGSNVAVLIFWAN